MRAFVAFLVLVPGLGGAAAADFAKVTDRDTFLELVTGKELTRPLVRLQVSEDGEIAGRGAAWDVTGEWTWQSGYFCRDLTWGGDDLGYNCQQVEANGRKIRFIADRGTGRSADFSLR
jgi:hypothetical protein